MLKAYSNNEYVKEKDLRHILKAELPEITPSSLDILLESLGLQIKPTSLYPFKQYNIPEIMGLLNTMLI